MRNIKKINELIWFLRDIGDQIEANKEIPQGQLESVNRMYNILIGKK